MIYKIEDQEDQEQEVRLNGLLSDLSLEEIGTMSEGLGRLIFRGVYDTE